MYPKIPSVTLRGATFQLTPLGKRQRRPLGTVPSQNLPENQGDLTLGASVSLDQTTPDEYTLIVQNLEKTGGPVINDHEYSTRNSNKN